MQRDSCVIGDDAVSYLRAGPADGHPLVLVHGLLADATTWARAMPGLAARGFRVVAPDLQGHGLSAKPGGARYSIAEFAATVRRLMDHLGMGTATIGGHSLGGGTAIALSHLHPERVDQLVLVASGGFGTQLHAVLRGATLPGAQTLLRLATAPRVSRMLSRPVLHRSLRLAPESIENLARMGRGLQSVEGRAAFFATLAENIDRSGQRGSMVEMGYVDATIPTLLVWSERDPIIPVEHALVAQEFLENSRLELFPGTSHEPHRRHPERFVDAVSDFVLGAK